MKLPITAPAILLSGLLTAAPLLAAHLPAVDPLVAGGDHSHETHGGHDHNGEVLPFINLQFAGLVGNFFDFATLNNANLHSAYLNNVSFRSANLAHADLSVALASSTDFTSADLSFANLSSASLDGTLFENADLSFANLTNADTAEATFFSTNLTGADLRSQGQLIIRDYQLRQAATASGVNFSGSDLTDYNLTAVDFSSANFNSSNLQGVNFDSTDLSGADLRNPIIQQAITAAQLRAARDITGVILEGNDLSDFNLNNVDLSSANLSFTNLNSANFSLANLQNANLASADLTSAILTGTNLRNGIPAEAITAAQLQSASNVMAINVSGNIMSGFDLSNLNLTFAGFSFVDATGATFNNASLKNALFRNANLTNALVATHDLTTADFSNALLDGAVLGDGSRYDGFIYEGQLDISSGTTTLESLGFAALGPLTNISNFSILVASNGLALGVGDNLIGNGQVQGKVAASFGSTIQATWNLVLGDAESYDGFFSDGILRTANNTVTLQDKGIAILGSLTELGADFSHTPVYDGAGILVAFNGLLLESGKNLIGHGYILGPLETGGTIAPGPSIGLLNVIGNPRFNVMGNYHQGPSGVLDIELAGSDNSDPMNPQYDALHVADTAGVAGTLNVSLIEDFLPTTPLGLFGGDGDSFTILTGNPVEDEFSKVTGLDYDNVAETGHILLVDQTENAVTLTAFQAAWGDTNLDRQVNSTDLFNILAAGTYNNPANWPATWGQGDFNDDGAVNSDDLFLILATGKYNQGPYSSVAPALQAVPEPSAFALAVCSLVALICWRGRRRHRLLAE